MRRKDRERDRAFALQVVDDCTYATLSMIDPTGHPYAVPVNVVREGNVLYFHAAMAGKKTDCLRYNPQVWISCVSYARVLAEQLSTAYDAAMIAGTAQEVTDETEKYRALQLLSERFAPEHMEAFRAEASHALPHTAVWRIEIDTITGKQKPDPERKG